MYKNSDRVFCVYKRGIKGYNMRLLFEGSNYDKKASKILVDGKLFNQQTADNVIDAIRKDDIGAFKYTKGVSWIEKYLMGIARMIVEESGSNVQKAVEFLNGYAPTVDYYLNWVRENRNLSPNPVEFDKEFNERMHFSDVVDFVEKMQDEEDAESDERLRNMEFSNSDYTLVPITSYEQMNRDYGGPITGDCIVDRNGECLTDWCHANGKGVYDAWTRNGNRFFVLEKDGWRDIPFDAESNNMNPKDEYGNSLIAILVDRNGRLKRSTLRCNHVGVPAGKTADNIYRTYADLSDVVGFNVQKAVKEQLGLLESVIRKFSKQLKESMKRK